MGVNLTIDIALITIPMVFVFLGDFTGCMIDAFALISLSYIKKQMQEKNLFKIYTMQGLLDKGNVIECFEKPGKCYK